MGLDAVGGDRCPKGSRRPLQDVPLADSSAISYFALDNAFLHGHNVSVSYDPSGARPGYRGCKGLCVYVDGRLAASAPALARLDNISFFAAAAES